MQYLPTFTSPVCWYTHIDILHPHDSFTWYLISTVRPYQLFHRTIPTNFHGYAKLLYTINLTSHRCIIYVHKRTTNFAGCFRIILARLSKDMFPYVTETLPTITVIPSQHALTKPFCQWPDPTSFSQGGCYTKDCTLSDRQSYGTALRTFYISNDCAVLQNCETCLPRFMSLLSYPTSKQCVLHFFSDYLLSSVYRPRHTTALHCHVHFFASIC